MSEIWKDIPGLEGLYKCSNFGNFKAPEKIENSSHRRCIRKEKILKTCHESNGYLQISIIVNKKQTLHLAHRLIALTFIKKIEGKDFVNHKNGIKDDNRVENLEWCTKSENSKHSFAIGTQCNKGEHHSRAKITDDIVREIRRKHIPKTYGCHKLAKEFGMSKTNILDILKRKTWSHVA